MNSVKHRGRGSAMRHMPRLVVFVALAAVAGAALAQSGSAHAQDVTFPAAEVLKSVYSSIADVFKNAGVSPNTGKVTILALYTMSVALGGLKIAGGMDPIEAVIGWVKLSMLAAFALAAIQPMPWLAALTGSGGTLGEMLRGGFVSLGNSAIGGESGTSGASASALEAAGSFMQTIFRVLDVQIVPPDIAQGDWMDKALFVLSNPVSLLVACLMLLFTIVALAVAGAIVTGEVFFALLSMDLAIAMAPLLVPWVLFPPLSFLFDAWLRTLLIGGMAYVVSSLIAKGAAAFADTMVRMTEGAFADGDAFTHSSVALAYGAMFLASIVFVLIAIKLSSLAGSLIQGSGVSGVGILGFRMATGGIGKAGSPMTGAGGAVGRYGAGVGARGAGLAAGASTSKMSPGNQARMNNARYVLTGGRPTRMAAGSSAGSTSPRKSWGD